MVPDRPAYAAPAIQADPRQATEGGAKPKPESTQKFG